MVFCIRLRCTVQVQANSWQQRVSNHSLDLVLGKLSVQPMLQQLRVFSVAWGISWNESSDAMATD